MKSSRIGFSVVLVAPLLLGAGTGRLLGQPSAHLVEGVREYVAVDAEIIALKDATVIDGTGAPARPGQTILIEGGRITSVGPSGDVEIPEGAEVIDAAGHTVIPGLVGLHNHIFYTAAGGRRAQLNFSAVLGGAQKLGESDLFDLAKLDAEIFLELDLQCAGKILIGLIGDDG